MKKYVSIIFEHRTRQKIFFRKWSIYQIHFTRPGLKVLPSLIKYRNDINENEYIDSYRSKSDSKNFL